MDTPKMSASSNISMLSASSSTRERRLEAEIEQFRLEKARLESELRTATVKTQLFETKVKRAQSDLTEAQSKSRTLEQDVLRLKQETEEVKATCKEELRDLTDQFTIERKTLENALDEANRREIELRKQERIRAAELQAALEKLEEEKKKSLEEATTSTKKRRLRRGNDEEELDEENEQQVSDLKRKIELLKAENKALQTGAAVTERFEEMRGQLLQGEKRERLLKEEIEVLTQDRKRRIELSSQVDELKGKISTLEKELDRQFTENAQIQSLRDENERWVRLFNATSVAVNTPADAALYLSSQSRSLLDIQHSYLELKKEHESLRRQYVDAQSRISELETTIETSNKREEELKQKCVSLERKCEDLNQSRVAAERVLSSIDSSAAPASSTDQVKILGSSLEEVRKENSELRIHLQRLEKENERLTKSVGQGAFDPSTTKVLHMKPAFRSDLHQQNKSSSGEGSVPDYSVSTRPGEDAETARKRLKEQFKHHVLMYKEAVYLLFGWKVEMTTDAMPLLRLRSRFAEKQDDALLFRFNPKDSLLELIDTDFGRTLLNTPTYLTYLVNADSIPAFLSSLQLDLFGQQTLI